MAKRRFTKKKNTKKTEDKVPNISEKINSEVIAEALSTTNQPVFIKLCRLCESKDGPFLNIFDPDMITAKKIESVMPFVIAENDELPHKICFRCSAKVEELYEFIQKCTQSQHNLRKTLENKTPLVTKSKHRDIWEEKLNQSNISNDDICDALIKKAMEGIKDIPLKPFKPLDDLITKKTVKKIIEKTDPPKDLPANKNVSEEEELPFKNVKVELNKVYEVSEKKILRSYIDRKLANAKLNKEENTKELALEKSVDEVSKTPAPTEIQSDKTEQPADKLLPPTTNTFSLSETTPQDNAFNIMDHVSMIKVNGVGILFQCKLCNRNFLKKEVVMSHACAKNKPGKFSPKPLIAPEIPQVPSVKYINTRIDNESMKPINDKPISVDDDDDDDKPLSTKSKPRVGPASKVKRNNGNESSNAACKTTKVQVSYVSNTNIQTPIVQFPSIPSLNSRYKLMPGPNNTFTLVEEKANDSQMSTPEKIEITFPSLEPIRSHPIIGPKRMVNARKKQAETSTTHVSISQPYPVGLFKTLPTTSAVNTQISAPPLAPVSKKQSYTVVQTGNPSKLLISTKLRNAVQEVPKKRLRKARHETMKDDKEPYSVTLEDEAPPRDTEFFTFINVDPLLQPSYVLPTNNIIQESQISTSTSVQKESENKDLKYTCNMCNQKFTREKKLLSHIQSHYNKMDEEDHMRSHPRKRKK